MPDRSSRPFGLARLAERGVIDLDDLYAWLKEPLPARAAASRDRMWAAYQRTLRGVEVAEAELDLAVLKRAGAKGPTKSYWVRWRRLVRRQELMKGAVEALVGLYLSHRGRKFRGPKHSRALHCRN